MYGGALLGNGSGNSGGGQVVVFGFQDVEMHIADADHVAIIQLFVLDLLAVNKRASPTLVILQEQASVVLYQASMGIVHRAGVQNQGVILRAAKSTDVACNRKNRAAVVLESELIHLVFLAIQNCLVSPRSTNWNQRRIIAFKR